MSFQEISETDWRAASDLPQPAQSPFVHRSDTVYGKLDNGRIARVQYWFVYGLWLYAGTQVCADVVQWSEGPGRS